MRKFDHLSHNKRGQALPGFVIGLFAFLGLSAGAVDISRHAFTATELQNLVDAAASAAAKAAGNNGSPYGAAQAISSLNTVNGEHLTLAAGDVVIGTYNGNVFTPGGSPSNAVRVTATKTLSNIISGLIGHPTSTISRTATAAIVALGGGVPTMPIALGETYWQQCIQFGCSQPEIILVPDGVQNAGWTAFFASASTNQVRSYVPAAQGCNGGGQAPPYITVGDSINLNNGQGNQLLAVQCLVCTQGQNGFLVPVVRNLGQFNQSAEVVGFATVVVESFNYSSNPRTRSCGNLNGGGTLQTINVRSVFNANTPGPPGPGFYGSGYAQVVG